MDLDLGFDADLEVMHKNEASRLTAEKIDFLTNKADLSDFIFSFAFDSEFKKAITAFAGAACKNQDDFRKFLLTKEGGDKLYSLILESIQAPDNRGIHPLLEYIASLETEQNAVNPPSPRASVA